MAVVMQDRADASIKQWKQRWNIKIIFFYFFNQAK